MANDILVKRIYKEWIKFKKYRSNDQTVSIQFIQFLNDKKILDRKISFNEKNDFECSLNSDDLGINVNFCDNSIVPGTALYKCADLFVAEIVRIGEINNESHSVVKECIEKKSVQIQNNDDSLFLDYTAVLNNLVINNSKGKQELVTDDNALRALYYLSQCSIEKPGDILLLCSSANLLNKYRSQNDALINDDKFKNFLCEMLTAICSLKINNINFSIDYSNEKNNDFLIIQSGNIQFSFYGSFSELDNLNLTEYRKNLKWDEIRKKPLANTLFSMVKSNILLLSNKTKDNKNMLESCEILINQYLNNTIKAKDIINICFGIPDTVQNNSSVDESIVEPVNKSDNSLSGANIKEVNDVNKVLYSYFLNYFQIASHERIEDIDITDEDFDRIVTFFKSILGESVSIRKIKKPSGFTSCYIDIPSLNITVGSCSSKRDNVKRALKKLLSKIYEGINSETKQQIKKSSNNACDVEEMMFKSYKCICSLLKEYSFDLNNTNETFTNEMCHRIEEELNLILPHKITGKTDKSNKHYSVSSADLGAHGTSNSGCRSLDANMHTAYRKFVKDIISKATKTNSPNNPPVSKKQNTVKKEAKSANTKVSATETKSKKIAVNDVDFYRNLVKKEWFKFKSGKNGFKEPYQFIKHLNSIKLLPHSIIVNEISAIECEIHSVDLEMNVNFRNPSISKGTGPDHASHTFIRKLHELTAK